ncbi:DNA-3-methyladenine glycosidase [Candidatus Kaiserbacteria bacterium]|nr:MAG: DNA-3-methyladenine glycosidase [Candidatus Kaiserbacteria bacterium]
MPKKVLNHFKKTDIVLYTAIIDFNGDLRSGPALQKDLFVSLCRTIVGQQLSGKAATAIWKKFKSLFPRNKPTAKAILSLTEEELRASGIAYSKVRAVRDLSERVTSRSLRLNTLSTLNEDEAHGALQAVKGIGPWTSEMFLMFALGHEDIFSTGDLGLQKGIQKIYRLQTLPTKEKIENLAMNWSPYRTYAACAIWSILDNQ